MPMYEIDESAVTKSDMGITVAVHVIDDNGTTAQVRIEDCGITLRQGHVHTVASDQLRFRNH